jgi:hypothetical protein
MPVDLTPGPHLLDAGFAFTGDRDFAAALARD